ncbi:hypothetical protein WJX81_002751 [Elliptochloris bilobata]|uniref:Uncharacterized protein n=1 Tax=Elliptochloris bilobata TaxID=381761 RepID=A0AAW1S6W0_9CHLO
MSACKPIAVSLELWNGMLEQLSAADRHSARGACQTLRQAANLSVTKVWLDASRGALPQGRLLLAFVRKVRLGIVRFTHFLDLVGLAERLRLPEPPQACAVELQGTFSVRQRLRLNFKELLEVLDKGSTRRVASPAYEVFMASSLYPPFRQATVEDAAHLAERVPVIVRLPAEYNDCARLLLLGARAHRNLVELHLPTISRRAHASLR